jgi:hypothetical protein
VTPTPQHATGSAGAGKKSHVALRPVIEDYQLPLRYRRQPLDEKEIAYINVCKLVIQVGFEVVTAVSMKIAVFWVVAPCCLVEVYQRFSGPCCRHHQGDDSPLKRW